jgi:ABC-type glutathione transport system ATPase component
MLDRIENLTEVKQVTDNVAHDLRTPQQFRDCRIALRVKIFKVVCVEEDFVEVVHAATRMRGRDIAMVFQDPMSSLNPMARIGRQIEEMIALHSHDSRRRIRERVIELLSRVGIVVSQTERCGDVKVDSVACAAISAAAV